VVVGTQSTVSCGWYLDYKTVNRGQYSDYESDSQYSVYDGKHIMWYMCYDGNHGWYIVNDGELLLTVHWLQQATLCQYYCVRKSMASYKASIEWYEA